MSGEPMEFIAVLSSTTGNTNLAKQICMTEDTKYVTTQKLD